MPKFNLGWVYLVILMMIVVLWFSNEGGSSSREVPYDEFQEYVQKGYVSRVIGYDDNSVEAYIKQEHVKDVFMQDSNRVGKRPYVMTEAPSRTSLGDFIQEEKDKNNFNGSISYEKKRNYFGLILWQIFKKCSITTAWL